MRHFFRLLTRSAGRGPAAAPLPRVAKAPNANAKVACAATGTAIGALAGYAAFNYWFWDDRLPGTLSRYRPRVYASESATLKVGMHTRSNARSRPLT